MCEALGLIPSTTLKAKNNLRKNKQKRISKIIKIKTKNNLGQTLTQI
jgi:hypothetical protein